MPELELVTTVATDLAADACHLTTPIWISACGRFVGYPADGAIVVLEADGLTEVRRVALPDGDVLRSQPRDQDESVEGIQCGAIGPGGTVVAFATDERIAIGGDGADWRVLSILATEDELASGAVDDEDVRWLGAADGLAFDHAGGLWLAGTHIEGRERITRIDAATATIVASADLADSYPDPVYVTVLPAPRGIGISIACGQDGCAVSEVRLDGDAITVLDAVRFEGPSNNLLGWAPDGTRIVARFDALERIAPDGPAAVATVEAAGTPAGAVVGPVVIRQTAASTATLHDATTLAPLATTTIAGAQLYPLADGLLTLGDGDGWGTFRRYRLAP
jgi:hypothetical protein